MSILQAWGETGYTALDHWRDHGETNPQWQSLATFTTSARMGDFSSIERIKEIVLGKDIVLSDIGVEVLGDCAPIALMYDVVPRLVQRNLMAATTAGLALANAGRLADVPMLWQAFTTFQGVRDNGLLMRSMNRALGPTDLPSNCAESLEEYRGWISRRYHTLCDRYGTNLVYLHYGEPLDIVSMARGLLRDAMSTDLLSNSKLHLIEANTGISRAGFYRNGRVQRLTIAACLEEFLESDAVDNFVVGERRFFGHKLEPASAAAQELFPGTELFRDALDVDDGFVIDCWNWDSSLGGYATAVTPYGGRIPNPPESEKWRSLAAYLGRARAGGDVPITTVGTWVMESDDEDFLEVAADLVVDLTDEDLGSLWKPFLEANTNPDNSLTLCLALLHRGLLADVPLVLSSYRKNADVEVFEDLQYVLNELFWLMPESAIHSSYWHKNETFSRPPLFKTAEECCRVVELRMDTLVKSLGSAHVPIFRNELLDVRRIAMQITELSDAKFLTTELRHLFEASTGIDCSTFFVDSMPQIEAAQTIARDFLVSPAGSRFEPGRRYFFGYSL